MIKSSNNTFINNRTSISLFHLKSCVWEITLECCFSCRYCGSKAGKARENELSTSECLSVANQLADMGCRRVSLIGGEVFMRKDWDLIVRELKERNVAVSIITNGFLLSANQISKIKSLSVESVAVSLDGPEHIHDMFRQKGSFQRAVQTMEILTLNKIPVSVISTLHSENVEYLEDMFRILSNTGIFAWQLQACSPMGNVVNGSVCSDIDFCKVINFVETHALNGKFIIGIADNIGYYSDSESTLRGDINGSTPFAGCRAGLTSIGIDSIGNVRGCESMYDDEFIEGNLRERSLREIWDDPNAFAYNRHFSIAQLTGKCRKCEYRYRCAGGCRSYNWFSCGKLFESPRCVRK